MSVLMRGAAKRRLEPCRPPGAAFGAPSFETRAKARSPGWGGGPARQKSRDRPTELRVVHRLRQRGSRRRDDILRRLAFAQFAAHLRKFDVELRMRLHG